MIDLQKFCSPNSWRVEFVAPFSVGKYTYATNGCICVRVPRIDGYREPGIGLNVNNIDEMMVKNQRMVPLPPIPPGPHYRRCHSCIGGGKQKCGLCHGSGEVECDMGHMHDCPECDGDSSPDGICEECGGEEVVVQQNMPVRIGPRIINANLLRLITDFQDVQLSVEGERETAMYFHFTGGDGVIMYMNNNWESVPVLVPEFTAS